MLSELCRLRYLAAGVILLAAASDVRAGTVTGLTLSPTEAVIGATVSATATGTNPCGAVHINWGDGIAITYPTSTLPVTQTHVYQTAGTFTVRASGMGNCDGDAHSRVVIRTPAAPPAPPPAAVLSAIELSPASAPPRTAVAIALQGSGVCRLTVDFGDGNSQDVNAQLPVTLRHTYAVAGSYVVTATPSAPCSDRRSATLEIGTRVRPRLAGIEVLSPPAAPAGMRSIKVAGVGRCAYTIDYGDGNTESRTAALPDIVPHNYPAGGRYTIVTTAAPPCSGVLRATFVVGGAERGAIARVEAAPQLATLGQPVTVTIAGHGTCRMTVDFDDGEARTVTEALPHRLTHRYARPGDYEIVVWTDEPCTGQGEALLRVRRR